MKMFSAQRLLIKAVGMNSLTQGEYIMKMKFSSLLILLGASLFSLVVASSSIAATRQAMIKLSDKSEFIFSGVFQGVDPAAFGIVEVGTGATPTVQFPYALVSSITSGTYTGSLTAFATKTVSRKNNAGACGPNNPLAGTAKTTQAFSTNAVASKCFKTDVNFGRANFDPLPANYTVWPALPGECNPKPGVIYHEPGSKKYGGTLQIFGKAKRQGQANIGPGGAPSNFLVNQQTTTMGTSTSAIVKNIQLATGGASTTGPSASAKQNVVLGIIGHWTTGKATVSNTGSPYSTFIPRTGGFNLVRQASTSNNTANLGPSGAQMTGTISAVRPGTSGTFNRVDGVYVSNSANYGGLQTVELTFLPEPTLAGLLGMGLIGLVSLRKLRQH